MFRNWDLQVVQCCLSAEYKWAFLVAGMVSGEVTLDHRGPIMRAIYSRL